MDAIIQWDQQLFHLINGQWTCAVFDLFFSFISDFGNFRIPLLIGLIAVAVRGPVRWKYLLGLCVLCVVFSGMIGNSVKHLVGRGRPVVQVEMREVDGNSYAESYNSLPSNHAVNIVAAAVFLGWHLRRRKWAVGLLAVLGVLVAYSRVYLGHHFPLDVLAGCGLGFCGAALFLTLDAKLPPFIVNDKKEAAAQWPGLTILFGFCAATCLWSWVITKEIPLYPVEALSWDLGRQGIVNHPGQSPLIFWLIGISTKALGNTAIGVRIPSVLMAMAFGLVSWLFTRRIFASPRITFFALLMLCLIPFHQIVFVTMRPDILLLLTWAGCCLALYVGLFEGKRIAWLVAGVCFGIGMLIDIAMVSIVLCLAMYFMISREHRFWLHRKEAWIFLALGLGLWLLFGRAAPVYSSGAGGFGLHPVAMLKTLAMQIGLVTPLLFGAMGWVTWRILWKERAAANSNDKYLLAMGVPVFALSMLMIMLRGQAGHWTTPAYFTLTILAVARMEGLCFKSASTDEALRNRRRVRCLSIAALVMAFAGFLYWQEPGIANYVVGKLANDDSRIAKAIVPGYRLAGYPKMARKVDRLLAKMPKPDKTFIVAQDEWLAAEMACLLKGQPHTYALDRDGSGATEPWLPNGTISSKKGWDAIFISEKPPAECEGVLADDFQRVDKPIEYKLDYNDRDYGRYTIACCYGFKWKPDAANADEAVQASSIRSTKNSGSLR